MKTLKWSSIKKSHYLPLGITFFTLFTILFLFVPPDAVDWVNTFYPVSNNILHPYTVRSFLNAPWIALILAPLGMFPMMTGLAINASLGIVMFAAMVINKKGSLLSVILTITSYPVIAIVANGSIEWVAALALMIQGTLGTLLLIIKPQTGILISVKWFRESKHKGVFLLILGAVFTISFAVWGLWPLDAIQNIIYVRDLYGLSSWNISLFPWSIPIGIVLMYYAITNKPENEEIIEAFATLCFAPYFTLASMSIFISLFFAEYPKIGIPVWIGLWLIPLSKII